MTGDTCILTCKVKTFMSSAGRHVPNNQTSKKTEQGRWGENPKKERNQTKQNKTITGNIDRRLYHQQ